MLNVLCWKWGSHKEYRAQYTSDHVNILLWMLKRNLTIPFRLFCITDDDSGIDKEVIPYPIWNYPKVDLNPKKPNCYRRLRMFAAEARQMFGERILSIDLDCVIVANIDSIVSRDEDFVAWNKKGVPYQGGLILHKTGTRRFLWDDFDPKTSPRLGASLGFVGSDQAWISAKLPRNEAVWTPEKHGILSYKANVRNNPEFIRTGKLPDGAKIVFYHGSPKPWETRDSFIQEHWRIGP
jgi:hypothetical protein